MTVVRGVLALAWLETRRSVSFLEPRLALVAVAAAAILAWSWPVVEERGLAPDAGLFVAEVAPGSPLLPALENASAFRVSEGEGEAFRAHRADLYVDRAGEVTADPASARSRAAYHALDQAARAWLTAVLEHEPDQVAAFPVEVGVAYAPRVVLASDGTGPASAPSSGAPSGAAGGGADGGAGAEAGEGPGSADDLLGDVDSREEGLRPDDVDPPFPVRSLLLSFAYLIPANVVSQLYAGSILELRTRRRGLLILAGPVRGGGALAGLSLPYLLATLFAAAVVTLAIGAGWLAFAAILPVLGALLAASLLGGLLARSQREMTFVLVAVSTSIATFLFLPAMFVEVEPIAFLSPVTVVAASVRGELVPLGPFLYATLPLAFAGIAMAAVGVGLFREEHMFAPAPVLRRFVAGLGELVGRRGALFLGGVLAVPFAFALELMLLVVAIMLDLRIAFLVFLFGSAFVEEALKGLVAVSHLHREGGPRRGPLVVGPLVGAGFFLGEKLALVVSLVGFGFLPLGEAALATFGVGTAALLVAAPLVLHIATVTVTSFAARRGRRAAVLGCWAAGLVHASYNAALVFGGALG